MFKSKKLTCVAVLAAAAMGTAAPSALASVFSDNLIVPAIAGSPNTTSQLWGPTFPFTTTIGPNATSTPYTNVNGVPDAYSGTAPDDGAFITSGGNLYSFSAITHPTIFVPNFGFGSGSTQIILQTGTSGTQIDFSTVTVTPLGGSPVVVDPADITHTFVTSEFSTPDGPVETTDDYYKFVWNLPGNAPSYTLSFAADGPSSSWVGARVDTLAVPEPASLGILGVSGLALLMRRRRQS